MDDYQRRYPARGCALTMGLIIVGVFALAMILTLVVEQGCENVGESWLPTYPNAEVVSERYTFLQIYGIGTTQRSLYSPDDHTDVRRWYNDQQNAASREGVGRGSAQFVARINEAEDGGTTIDIYFECAPELDLSPFGIGRGGGTSS